MKAYDIFGNEVGPLRAGELLADHDGRRVGRTSIILGDGIEVLVSTVHLVFDHGWGNDRRIFETMVFMNRKPDEHGLPFVDEEMDCCRYATLSEARAGHDRMVQRYKRLTHPN